MNLEEIKAAVEAGRTVHWAHEDYIVIKDETGQWFIKRLFNGSCVDLHQVKINPEDFYIADE